MYLGFSPHFFCLSGGKPGTRLDFTSLPANVVWIFVCLSIKCTGYTSFSIQPSVPDGSEPVGILKKEKKILKGISIYFNPGELVGIMGPSGTCGVCVTSNEWMCTVDSQP